MQGLWEYQLTVLQWVSLVAIAVVIWLSIRLRRSKTAKRHNSTRPPDNVSTGAKSTCEPSAPQFDESSAITGLEVRGEGEQNCLHG